MLRASITPTRPTEPPGGPNLLIGVDGSIKIAIRELGGAARGQAGRRSSPTDQLNIAWCTRGVCASEETGAHRRQPEPGLTLRGQRGPLRRARGWRCACDDGLVRKVLFTGRPRTERSVLRDAAETINSSSLELAGDAPGLVLESAVVDDDLGVATACAVWLGQELRAVTQVAIWARDVNPSLRRMFSTCVSAVRGEITSVVAISLLVIPRATRLATSLSRGVSGDEPSSA